MTHDFHFYVTYMCARNAGFSRKSSIKIALCADGVDGGSMKFIKESNGAYMKVAEGDFYPVTVHHLYSSVNSKHSLGSSIASVPWMAYHFLPSLEVKRERNAYFLEKGHHIIKKTKDRHTKKGEKALALESGLICTNNSRFAHELIRSTAAIAAGCARNETTEISSENAAKLGIRAHIIADLFAHSGFAGCRSININALDHCTDERKKDYHYSAKTKGGGEITKAFKSSRLGHGQALQRPDEPYIEYSFKRNIDGKRFVKDNYDLYGQALVTLTQVLKGDVITGSQPTDYENWYKRWKELERNYRYKWVDIRDDMNKGRKERVESLYDKIWQTEGTNDMIREVKPYLIGYHDLSDEWPFKMLKDANVNRFPDLAQQFSNEANKYMEWFHYTFSRLSGVDIATYLDISLFWLSTDGDDKIAKKNTQLLMMGEKLKIGKTSGELSGDQIGTQYMAKGFGPDMVFNRLENPIG